MAKAKKAAKAKKSAKKAGKASAKKSSAKKPAKKPAAKKAAVKPAPVAPPPMEQEPEIITSAAVPQDTDIADGNMPADDQDMTETDEGWDSSEAAS
jgi:hypothetical protein